ncbi:double-strand break repair helicase AddA [Sedimentitalea sp. JM2-8]|uniref:DNA 3'-5' helicase n=1 Tax=Sedimentitalea xiamensis TaxID=3050037 RepID=A0ABT7F9Z8_9RHOB|nr:double-strand break repair helicase AddA [Sedimentitalea xiamensis]MDK3071795.1 double-strand break repair helicase AddA [Sedimentitalea xiamensis]
MTVRNDATEAQVIAARPDASTWLAANAGSGKTHVLTDRVARLLLNGVRPEQILCLTYTKAAASEMQNRLFKRLGAWSMLDNDTLERTLADLGADHPIPPERLSHARTLFARAIEAPGGLKIQTIHSFCASLLRRFPLEAGVSPQFTEMSTRAADLLQAEIVEDFAGGPNAPLIDDLAVHVTDTGFETLTRNIVQHNEAFQDPMDWQALENLLDLPPDLDEDELARRVFLGSEASLLADLREALQTGSKLDQNALDKLTGIATPTLADLPVLESVFLTGAGAKTPFSAKVGTFPTKPVQAAHAMLMSELDPFMQRVEAARALRIGLAAARKSFVLHRFAAAFLKEYARRKQIRGWLDFDDLIQKARRLLNDPSVAQWVLYRLDGGIDHILVDEAQDTSPAQWDVVEKLAQEFSSGMGARADVQRTIFVVGDKKQSIYSFQGADPDEFDRMQIEFDERLRHSGTGLQNRTLEYSFRSSKAILNLVDLVFTGRAEAGFPVGSVHHAFKSNLPGRVDLWPVVEKSADVDDRVWTDPVDRPSPKNHNLILAERIARTIRTMIETGETIPVDGDTPGALCKRPVQAGDFLILVQRRSDLFAEIIRACKAERLEIAGADRLKVGAELAVKDLAALLGFLATPEDSVSLATALRSPLFGWSEQDLFDLAHRRDTPFLWTALRQRHQDYPGTMAILNDLRSRTDFMRPYDLIERILTRHDGRRKLLGRLGTEAEDGINALLSQALAYEKSDVPSLTGFLVWMETDDLEIKREMGSVGNMVRVMTVHGAKGLESPIVILPDTAARRGPQGSEIVTVRGRPLWRMNAAEMPDTLQDARDQTRDRQMNERLRLLYVAMTRAEKWLIVAAAGDLDKNGDTWYQIIESGLNAAGADPFVFPFGPGLRLSHADWGALEPIAPPRTTRHVVPAPGFLKTPARPPDPVPATLSPSDLGGEKALPGDAGLDEEAAKQRGTRIHTLLERLPDLAPRTWPSALPLLLPDCTDPEREDVFAEASAVLADPALRPLFAPGTLGEVAVSGDVHGLRTHGVIDRLVIGDDFIHAIDFKTNATVPGQPETCPEGLLRQMGAYVELLRQIYPDRRILTSLLWTRTATLMRMPDDLVTEALLRSPRLDADRAST